MGKSRISKINKQLDKIMTDTERQIKLNQCECSHQFEGRPTLEKYRKTENGKEVQAYRCTQCKKFISMQVPSFDDVKDAYKTIDTAMDYMKIAARLRNEKQEKMKDKVVSSQKIGLAIIPAYGQILRVKEKQSQNNNRRKDAKRRAFYDDN